MLKGSPSTITQLVVCFVEVLLALFVPHLSQSEQQPAPGSGHFIRGLRSFLISAGVPRHVLNTEFTLRPTTPRAALDLRIFILTTEEREVQGYGYPNTKYN